MRPQFESNTKNQPWKPFQSGFKGTLLGPITYDGPKGTKLKIPGTSGEFSLTVLYDTENIKPKT